MVSNSIGLLLYVKCYCNSLSTLDYTDRRKQMKLSWGLRVALCDRTIPPWTTPPDNSPSDNCPHRTISPRTTPPLVFGWKLFGVTDYLRGELSEGGIVRGELSGGSCRGELSGGVVRGSCTGGIVQGGVVRSRYAL